MRYVCLSIALLSMLATAHIPVVAAQDYRPPVGLEPIHRPLDEVLDLYVRDGLVYYRALDMDRARLDRYLAAIAAPALASALPSWNKPQQVAFWINAYNALVLRTVVDRYPIRGTSPGMPANSIRQIPGAFDQRKHEVAGRSVTLDQIETSVLADSGDPRIFLVLGRGAVGSGRLRSEAFSGPRLEEQLAQSAAQFATTPKYVHIDPLGGSLGVSAIFSWRGEAFAAGYASKAMDLPKRTPIELAVVGFIQPHLTPPEREFLLKNTFKLAYEDFDWQLNDLTGR